MVLVDSEGLKAPLLPERDKGLPTGGRRPSNLPPKALFPVCGRNKATKGFPHAALPRPPAPCPGGVLAARNWLGEAELPVFSVHGFLPSLAPGPALAQETGALLAASSQ